MMPTAMIAVDSNGWFAHLTMEVRVVIAAAIGPWMTMFDLPRSLIAGVIVAVAGLLGNLNIAALDRDLGVKEAGSMLPGHGGVLDRIDSLIFTAPVFFHFVWYCYG